jgi:hypothetical protein
MPVLNHANAADYALIALYFGIVMFVGWYSSRKNQTTDDYFKGGGKIPWFLAGVSNWVSGFSAFMFVAAAGFTYKPRPRGRGRLHGGHLGLPGRRVLLRRPAGGGRGSTRRSSSSPAGIRPRRPTSTR